jgi:oligopeptidase B
LHNLQKVHGTRPRDDYAWLRAENWRDVLRDPSALPALIRDWLDEENRKTADYFAPSSDLIAALANEMRGRLKEDESSVPWPDGEFLYYTRYRQGGQHPVFCRAGQDADETILLDGDAEAEGQTYFVVGEAVPAPNHARLAWSVDTRGSEKYEIRTRAAGDARDEPDVVTETDGSIVWMSDSGGYYYVRLDENHRTCRVYRHRFDAPEDDRLVFDESDPAWFVDIRRLVAGHYALIVVSDHDSNESHLIDLRDPAATPRLIEPRTPHQRYYVELAGQTLFIRTNAEGAEDFAIYSAPLAAPGRANWSVLVPHRVGCMIKRHAVFPNHLVWLELEDGLPRIAVRDLSSGDEHHIAFAEEAYHLDLLDRMMFDSETLRFVYSSMTTPRETYDYNLSTRVRVLRKRQTVPSGHDPRAYVTARRFATAPDGAEVPITLVHRADLVIDGRAPLLLYGYGAYGHALPASFSTNLLSLVDRGFVYALAHVRGGTDKGWRWYLDGKLDKKPNTFSDFIAVAEALIAQNYTSAGLIVAQGGSAGGLLMGAVANLAPHLFAGIIAAVPFVDVLNTILDADLPLTPTEWREWGNPIEDPAAFATIQAYSPYDNVKAQAYPPIFALGGVSDPRVTYWEPAKWVARLRATMTGGGPILLKTNMGAGHAGASGRFDRLSEIAEYYAFALRCAAEAGARLIPR